MTATTDATDLTVSVETQQGSQVKLTIEAPAEELDRAIATALQRFSQQMRLPGFRPGKAPIAVVERQVGWEAVRQEAAEALVPALYIRALQQEEIDPVSDPDVDLDPTTLERGRPVTFSVTVTVRPKVDLGDYRALRAEQTKTEIGDAEVDEAIAEARRRHATLTDVERPAQLGDILICVLEMRHGDEVLTGGGEERELELDAERLLPGLAEAIVGMESGQERTFTLTLPDDYPREELRNSEVGVTCQLRTVKARELPPLDDSLAALDKRGETLEEMRETYRKLLIEQAEVNDRETFEGAMLEQLRDCVTVAIPEIMIDNEIDRKLRDLEYRYTSMGLAWDQYLSLTGQTEAQLRGQSREEATQRVKLELALDALAKAEGIEVDESAVHREEQRVAGNQKLTAAQRRRLHEMTHVDLARQSAAARLLEIGRGDV